LVTTYSGCKEEGIESFLSKYYEIKKDREDQEDRDGELEDGNEFERAGIIQNAINVEFYSSGFDQIIIESEGMQLPNLGTKINFLLQLFLF
jgi:hypothetical protein